MNLSERIRGCLESPKTATQVESELGVDAALVRGCIQSMFYSGMVSRIGGRRPYQYQAVRGPEVHKRGLNLNITQQVRACIREHGPIDAHGINEKTAIPIRAVRTRINELKKRNFIAQDAEGKCTFVRESKNIATVTPEEKREKARLLKQRQRKRDAQLRNGTRHEKCAPMTVVKKKPLGSCTAPTKPMTVGEWLAQGGVIDRSPTPIPFERLTASDIRGADWRGRPMIPNRAARHYLAG